MVPLSFLPLDTALHLTSPQTRSYSHVDYSIGFNQLIKEWFSLSEKTKTLYCRQYNEGCVYEDAF